MRLFRGRFFALVLIIFVAAGGAYVIFSNNKANVSAIPVSRSTISTCVEDTGKVQLVEEITVYAPLGGRIEKLPVKVGDLVKVGQVIAQVTQNQQTIAEAGLAKAQARVTEARRSEESARRLFESGVIPENEYNRAKTELKIAEDDLKIASAQYSTATKLGQTTLVAPRAGTILEVFPVNDQVLAPGAPVAVLGDLSRLEVRTELLTYHAIHIKAGQKAIISGAVLGDKQVEGVVGQVYPKAVTRVSTLGLEQQRVPIIINLAEEAALLRPGFDVDIKIITGSREGVLTVPKAAVFQKGRETCVYVMENGVARSRVIQLGVETGEIAEIVSGLEEDEVVVADPGVIKEGMRIRPSKSTVSGT